MKKKNKTYTNIFLYYRKPNRQGWRKNEKRFRKIVRLRLGITEFAINYSPKERNRY